MYLPKLGLLLDKLWVMSLGLTPALYQDSSSLWLPKGPHTCHRKHIRARRGAKFGPRSGVGHQILDWRVPKFVGFPGFVLYNFSSSSPWRQSAMDSGPGLASAAVSLGVESLIA